MHARKKQVNNNKNKSRRERELSTKSIFWTQPKQKKRIFYAR